jgi:hypothetical protein
VSRRNGIDWDAAIPCEMLRVYKPLPDAYRRAAAFLAVEPGEILMVACLLLAQLCLVRVDLGLLHGQLRIDVLDVGLGSSHLRCSLSKRGTISTIVNASDHVSGVDMLIVGYRDGCEVTRHLGGDGELARRYVSVVGRLETTGIVPIKIAGRR